MLQRWIPYCWCQYPYQYQSENHHNSPSPWYGNYDDGEGDDDYEKWWWWPGVGQPLHSLAVSSNQGPPASFREVDNHHRKKRSQSPQIWWRIMIFMTINSFANRNLPPSFWDSSWVSPSLPREEAYQDPYSGNAAASWHEMVMMVTMMQVILGSSTWRLRWRWGADIPLTCILIGQYFITVIICMIHIFV